MNLTTLNRVKTFGRLTGTGQDTLLLALIGEVSGQVANLLGADLEVTTYRSWVDGGGASTLRLDNWPLLAVYHVAVNALDVGEVWNNSSSVERAEVSIDATQISLIEHSSAGAETITDKTFASAATLSTLETAIETVSGWNATIDTGYGNWPSVQIRPLGSQYALYPDTADLWVPDDSVATKILYDNIIELRNEGEFPAGRANIFVHYKAGWTLPTNDNPGTVPPGLLLLVNQMVLDASKSAEKNGMLRSESLGDYSYSLGEVTSIVESRKNELMGYGMVQI